MSMFDALGALDDETLAKRLEALSPAKRAFVEAQLKKLRAQSTPSSEPVLGPRVSDAPAPLSFAQELLWLIQQGAPASSAYNVPRALRLHGALDVAALQAALDGVVARHEILRTRVVDADAGATQTIDAPRPVALETIDLSAMPAFAREDEMMRVLRDRARVPFDLTRDQLLRATLVRLGVDDHALLLVTHHVASDGGSKEILYRELRAGYDAARRGEAATLAPLAIQYADYATWQRASLAGGRLASHLDWWRTHLAHAPRLLELPTDFPRSAAQRFEGARHFARLDRDVRDAVVAIAQREQVTPFVVLLTATQVLLHRWTRQSDVVVGSVLTGRAQPELEGLLGLFSTLLPLRASFGDDPTFRDALGRARAATLGAVEHAALPFEKLALELRDGGDAASAPLVQATVAMVDEGPSALTLGEVAAEQLMLDRGVAKFDLSFAFAVEDASLLAVAEYRADLFEAATIERMVSQLATLIRSAERDATQPVSRIALLDDAARHEVSTRWNPAALETPDPAPSLHAWIVATASERPDAIAVECDGRSMTYATLMQRSERLARELASLGAGPGARVGVCMERSCELVVALLAVLRSGAAYVPVDPSYPADRIGVVFEDAAVPVVLTDDASIASLPATSAHVLRVDAADAWDDGGTLEVSLADAQGEAAAYVLFTSGSTGRPKGVVVPHRAVVNFLAGMQREPGLDPDDAIVAVTTVSFDIAGLELWLPLVTGARIVLATRATTIDGEALARLVNTTVAARPTLLQATPATWRLLIDGGWTGHRDLTALCGGEAWPAGMAEALLARAGSVWNVYGPTETTIWSTIARVMEPGTPSLGAPLRNTWLYVLEPSGEPAPVGVAGELLIGGAGVALGYLGRADLTAERFVTGLGARGPVLDEVELRVASNDPSPGPRAPMLYRTGDLVRRRADGRLDYLGRLDAQIKLRGHRIELEEIEAVCATHPAVKQVVVALHGEGSDANLAAHVVTVSDAGTGDAALGVALRKHVSERLPAYMVPATVAFETALPLTPNGKVDRRALKAPVIAREARPYVAPRNDRERAVATIWASVLDVAEVSVDAGFLELGGHSLLAVRVLGRIQRALGVAPPLELLLTGASVADVCEALDAAPAAEDDEFDLMPVSRDQYRRPASALGGGGS